MFFKFKGEDVQGLDSRWFEIGYICGSSSVSEIPENPRVVHNLGKQGVSLVPANSQELFSLICGILIGRRYIYETFGKVEKMQTQDRDGHNPKGKYLCLSLSDVEGAAGQEVLMPLSICNNSVENRGYAGLQALISYPINTIEYINYKQNNPLLTIQARHDAARGVVQIQALQDVVEYVDAVQLYLNFRVKEDVRNSQTIRLNGPSGTGQGSDVLTLINGDYYYIMPLTLENGDILINETPEEKEKRKEEEKQKTPQLGSEDDYIGPDVRFTYDFELDLEYGGSGGGSGGGGSGGGHGGSLHFRLYYPDGSYDEFDVPVQEGLHRYQGDVYLHLPEIKKGPFVVEYWFEPEDEDDLYYWFVKPGALWGFESETPRDQVGELEEKKRKAITKVFEWLILNDDYVLMYEGQPQPAKTDYVEHDTLKLIDSFLNSFYAFLSFSYFDSIDTLKDDVLYKNFKDWGISVFDIVRLFDNVVSNAIAPVVVKDHWEEADVLKIQDLLQDERFRQSMSEFFERLQFIEEEKRSGFKVSKAKDENVLSLGDNLEIEFFK